MRTLKLLQKALFAKSGEEFVQVTLPHTWNALDGQDGGSDYWRGTAVYKIELPAPTPGIKLMVIGFPMVAALCSFCCFTFIWNINSDVRAKMAQWKAAKAAR